MCEISCTFEARILKHIREEGLFYPPGKVVVAVSGGADSMALLHLLMALRGVLGIDLIAAHYEHGIRGEASVSDALFVRTHCASLGVPCVVGQGDVPRLAALWRCGLEDAARRARYAFLDSMAAENGARWIALGHQLEDQAETLLLHLVHGCGLSGLSAMRAVSGNRVRPLLEVSRAELIRYLLEKGVRWREDATNDDPAHARNLIRREVFPVLRKLNPRVAEAMARTARIAREAEEALESRAREALSGRIKRTPYGAFLYLPGMTLDAGAVRAFATWAGVPPLDARQVGALLSGGPCNLPGGWRAATSKTRLHLLRETFEIPPLREGDFVWTPCEPGTLCDGIRAQVFDADALPGASFRYRRDGDVFAPLAGPGTQKLKQTLRDAGVDRPFRAYLPVLAAGSRVLWIVGVKPGADARVRADTKRAVRIDYLGELPWENMQEEQTDD